MASPFKVFRKNQKLWLAILAILAMFGFVILPLVLQGMGYRKSTNPRVVTTTEYGDLKLSDLRVLRWQRQTTRRFLRAVQATVYRAGGDPLPIEQLILRIGSTGEEELIESWLLANRAEQLGLVIDEKAIVAFVDYLTQDRIGSEELERILKGLGVNENALFAALEQDLLALRLREMFSTSLSGTTPAQRWDIFQRLKRTVTIESVPVRVADFVDEIEDPDESTLEAFFEQHKAEAYNPTSPEPGFREPQKIAIEYLKAEFQEFFDAELEAVSKEEIQQYYDEHKEDYRQRELPKPKDDQPEGPPAEDSEPKAEEDAEPKAEEDAEPKAKEDAEPKAKEEEPIGPKLSAEEEAPTVKVDRGAEDAEPEAKLPADSNPQNEQKPAETKPADEADPGSTDAEDTSSMEAASPFRLTSLLQEDAEEDETAKPDQPPADSDRPGAGAPVEKPEAASKPAPKPPAQGTPPKQPSAKPGPAEGPEAESASPEEGAAEPQDDVTAEPQDDATAEPQDDATAEPRYLPFEEVEEEIRAQLARERAGAKIEQLMSQLRGRLARYHDDLISFQVLKRNEGAAKTLTPPTRPDFRALAKQHKGLTAHKTGLISMLEALSTDIGKSLIRGDVPFARYAFEQQKLPKSRPAVSQPAVSKDAGGDAIGNYYYVFWKVDEAEERIPKFEDPGVRERVLRQWKTIQARSVAKKEAERMAAEAGKTGKPFAEIFSEGSDYVVTQSEPFTWLTYGGVPAWLARGLPEISGVNGVEMPGNDFMRAVFDLQKGEVGTAVNDPQTVVYVVRISESNPLPENLWNGFVSESYLLYRRAAWPDNAAAQKAWLDQIKAEAGFQWDPEWQRESPLSRTEYE